MCYIIERQVPSMHLSRSPTPPFPFPPSNNVRPSPSPRKNNRHIRLCLFPLSTCPPPLIFIQICSFCYIANKSLHDAIEACRDLPIRFDVEFRPFTLMCTSSLIDANKGASRKVYLAKKLGKEQAEAKSKVALDMAEKAGLKMYAFALLIVSPPANTPSRPGPKTA